MKNKRTMTLSIACLAVALLPLAAAAATEGFDIPSADGVLIHATSQGSGPVVVLVHGWSCDAGYWAEQVADLSADHRVVTIDLAGHGASAAGRGKYTMAAFGADVAAVLDRLDLTDAVLVGHSMGGAVIVEAALAAPERVRGLIGIDNFQQLDEKYTDEQISGFLATFAANFAAVVPVWVGRMFPADADSALRAQVGADMAAAPQDVALSALEELIRWDGEQASARLAELAVPLMCINADLQPTNEEQLKAVVPGYQVRYLPGTGHFLFREKPAQFDALLRETLAQFE